MVDHCFKSGQSVPQANLAAKWQAGQLNVIPLDHRRFAKALSNLVYCQAWLTAVFFHEQWDPRGLREGLACLLPF